jgi:tetratricopeptide (TPR) repeat protein
MSESRVYIYAKWKIPKGKYNYVSKIYDASSRMVNYGHMDLFPAHDTWCTWTWYNFNTEIDEPGLWKFEIYIDGIRYVNESFSVVGIKPNRDIKRADGSMYQEWSLYNEAFYHQKRGDYDKAIPLYERALSKYESDLGSESLLVARCLHNMGWSYYSLGEFRIAKLSYNRALHIYGKKLDPEHLRIAQALSALGEVYMAIGDYNEAESLFQNALDIRRKHFPVQDTQEISNSLFDLAWLYQVRGEYARAIPLYQRAIATHRHRNPLLIDSLASCYLADGKIDDACNLFKTTGLTLGLAACHYFAGEYEKAITLLNKSFHEKTKVSDAKEIANILLGFSFEALGDLGMAKQSFKNAIDLIEAKWKALGASDRKNFLTGVIGGSLIRLDAYEGMVRIIIKEKKRNYQKKSLLYAEMVKSRTFLEMLAAKQAKGIGKYDQDIIASDRAFQKKISFHRKILTECKNAGMEKVLLNCTSAKTSLEEALQAYERFIDKVKLENSELASLIAVEIAPVDKIQSLMDPSLTLLEYFMTADSTYVWIVTGDSIKVNIGDVHWIIGLQRNNIMIHI